MFAIALNASKSDPTVISEHSPALSGSGASVRAIKRKLILFGFWAGEGLNHGEY